MGIWIELGIFLLVIAFGLWQIHDVKQEQKKREAQKKAELEVLHTNPDDAPR